ncbi:MAG TPA: DsbA family protein [Stellaceae bacterium]|nr:DsbA family protein [Stellaceae bacterium]
MRRILLIIAAVIVVAGGIGYTAMTRGAPPVLAAAGTASTTKTSGGTKIPILDGDIVLGDRSAPVTIVEYASLTCPHCADFTKNTLPDVKKNWIDTGKAKLVFRDYPLDAVAVKAAVIAHCGGPERFFGFVEVFFASQTSWAQASDPVAALTRLAKLGGLSDTQVNACLADEKATNAVIASRLAAEKQYDVSSTPTFFINGQRLVGDQPYSEFDSALAAASAS